MTDETETKETAEEMDDEALAAEWAAAEGGDESEGEGGEVSDDDAAAAEWEASMAAEGEGEGDDPDAVSAQTPGRVLDQGE